METINMHVKFEIEIPNTWQNLSNALETMSPTDRQDEQMDGQMDELMGQGESSIPPSNFVG